MSSSITMLQLFAIAAICEAMALSCTGPSENDKYLKSLSLEPELLTAVDSVNIDQFDLFQARAAVAVDGGWLIVSSVQGDYRLLFLNPETSEHFFAIRKGRGPGEMINGSSLHKNGDGAVFYDSGSAVCVKIRTKESIRSRRVVMDTIGVFAAGASRPVYMTSCGKDGFISGNLLDQDVWYSYYDDRGTILSDVSSLDFEEFSEGDRKVSRMLSSVYASNPDGSKVCVANVVCPSLSFSEVKSGILTEYCRYENPPEGIAAGRITEDCTGAFQDIDADEDYVYLIYSGNKYKGDSLPINECRHLVVYDWGGNPLRHFVLDRNISSVHIDGNSLWGASAYPESCVYRFILPD